MARTIRIHRIEFFDADGAGPVPGDVHATLSDDDPNAIALGLGQRSDVRRAFLPRAAWNALISALRRPNGDDWPDAVLAHPVTKDS
jgi:hypothetical protein